jgi:hypothetical protein
MMLACWVIILALGGMSPGNWKGLGELSICVYHLGVVLASELGVWWVIQCNVRLEFFCWVALKWHMSLLADAVAVICCTHVGVVWLSGCGCGRDMSPTPFRLLLYLNTTLHPIF